MTTTPDLLRLSHEEIQSGAIVVLRRDGWIQGDYAASKPGKTGCCLVEAIGRSTGLPPFALAAKKPRRSHAVDPDFMARWNAAHNLIDEIATSLGRDPENDELTPKQWLTNWNDTKSRTVEDVLDALERRVEGPA